MSVEDVQYLKNNSYKKSYMFIVDSNDRNKSAYKTPSEYSIQFTSPFKHVYSLDVLDASIPRTQYGIDTHNNSIEFISNNQTYKYQIPIGDYTDVNFINKFNIISSPSGIYIRNTSTPADERSTFTFYSVEPFAINIKNTSLKTVIGFNAYDSDIVNSEFVNTYNDVYAYQGNIPTGNLQSIPQSMTNNGISQEFVVPYNGILSGFETYIVTNEDISLGYTITHENVVEPITFGRIIVKESEYRVSIVFSNEITVVKGEKYKISFQNVRDKDNIDDKEAFIEIQAGELCVNVNMKQYLYEITAPGIYSLIGERYCMLRCPEIEQHMFRSRSYEKYTLGLAKIKLAVMGYDDSRFDFSSLPPREFHPIGKLSQLTFRFERPDGTLYNFRSINHTITFVVRYYEPIQEITLEDNSLVPRYNPNYFEYLQQQADDTESESDETDED